jgi:chaperonin GroEL
MIPKQIFEHEEAQKKLREGIAAFAAPVKATLGPAGRTVIVEDGRFVGGFKATKDGVSVAESLRFMDPVHDIVAVMMKQAARKTADAAGDGTTTSVVLAEAIINAYDALKSELPVVEVIRGIQKLCDAMIESLTQMAIPATPEMISQIATISTNNDPFLGALISEIFNKVDSVTVEGSKDGTTYSEVVKGLKIDKGYVSRYFITDHKKQECVLDDPYILFCDKEIKDIMALAQILKPIVENGQSLLIVGRLSDNSLSTINMNVSNKALKAAVVTPPAFGQLSGKKMEDLAFITGGKFFSDDTGDNLQSITMAGLGRAKRVTITANSTIIEPTDDAVERISERMSDLKSLKEVAQSFEIEDIDSRIESACGEFGIIHVGAPTEIETVELRDRVDDAVCAIRAAKEEGVLPGGGTALIDAFMLNVVGPQHLDEAREIMLSAVQAPVAQMLLNDGADIEYAHGIIDQVGVGNGFNVKTREFCDMKEAGIIDPAKVVKSALKNAVSVATTILHTSFVVTNVRDTSKN